MPWWYASLPLVLTFFDGPSPRLARAVQVYAVTGAITLNVGCGLSYLGLAAAVLAIGTTLVVFFAPVRAERLIQAIEPYARRVRGAPALDGAAS